MYLVGCSAIFLLVTAVFFLYYLHHWSCFKSCIHISIAKSLTIIKMPSVCACSNCLLYEVYHRCNMKSNTKPVHLATYTNILMTICMYIPPPKSRFIHHFSGLYPLPFRLKVFGIRSIVASINCIYSHLENKLLIGKCFVLFYSGCHHFK